LEEDPWARAAGRFAEATVPVLADSFGVPGAVFTVVGRTGTQSSKGVGYANIAARQLADPERTLFRVGSVSKPVTATTVFQLWERGVFDLRVDINTYVDRMAVPEAFDAPVTAHELLTHTAGFDEQLFGSGAPKALDLGTYLRATLPERVYPPGLLHSYSNHGYGLLGVLVEDGAGAPFAEVVDRMTFAPLGMTASTFRQPPPPELRERLATGYDCSGDECTPLPYDYISYQMPKFTVHFASECSERDGREARLATIPSREAE
jgi:CubicO group peptidase (beta-lactamase class C family)